MKTIELTPKQQTLLVRIEAGEKHGDPVPFGQIITTDDDRNKLKALAELGLITIHDKIPGMKGKCASITKAGIEATAVINSAARGEKTELLPEVPAAPAAKKKAAKPAKEPKAPKKPKTEDTITLNWAYRRLRRQSLNFFFGEDAEAKREARLYVETQVAEKYSALREAYEKDAPLKAACKAKGGFEAFLEDFFSHEIEPGSRSK